MGEGPGQGRKVFCQVSSLPLDLDKVDLRKAIDNFIEAPIEEIIKKLEKSGVVDKVGYMDRDIEVICASDKRVLERGAQEDVG